MGYKYEDVFNILKENNMKMISNKYINVNTPIEYICEKHKDIGVQTIKLNNIIRYKSKCPYCMFEEGRKINNIPKDIIKFVVEKQKLIYVDSYKKSGTTIIKFLCSTHKDKGIQELNWGSISQTSHNHCRYCNGVGRNTEDFQMIISKKYNNSIKCLSEYKDAKTYIKCKCIIHNYIWDVRPCNLLSGFGCPKCGLERTAQSKRIGSEVLLKRIAEQRNDLICLTTPLHTKDIIKCKCKKCNNIWETTYSNIMNPCLYTGCPFCNMSKGEKEIAKILQSWNIKYVSQKIFNDCRDINPMPFDFYLPDSNTCIEYQGKQHYYELPIKRDFDLKKIQKHDNLKYNYCIENNINYIEVPYWEKENLEYFLFDKFINMNILEVV